MRATHWLRYEDSNILFLSFEVNGLGKVEVEGPLGASGYVSEKMSKEEAREFWQQKQAEGWQHVGEDMAPDWERHKANTYGH